MKIKRTLLSLFVFLAVFSMSELIEIPRRSGIAQDVNSAVADNGTTLSVTASDQMRPISYKRSDSTDTSNAQTDDNMIPNDTDSDKKNPNEENTDAVVAEQLNLPEEDHSLYSDLGIAIADDYVNVREKADTDSDVLGKLYKDGAAKILSKKNDWYYVESGSIKGYVKSEFIKTGFSDEELIKKYGRKCMTVKVDGLNVRKKPDMDSEKVDVIYRSEIYPVIKEQGDWIKVNLTDDHRIGYVKSEFAEVRIEFDKAVSKEEEQTLLRLKEEERLKKETLTVYRNGISYSKEDLKLLACLVQAEAGSQTFEGKLAVANIVLNRVKSGDFPDSIENVIYSPGQFTVASSGSLRKQLDSYTNYNSNSQLLSIKAAQQALEGANNIGSRLYFHSYRAAVRKGYDKKSTSVKIDDQLFW